MSAWLVCGRFLTQSLVLLTISTAISKTDQKTLIPRRRFYALVIFIVEVLTDMAQPMIGTFALAAFATNTILYRVFLMDKFNHKRATLVFWSAVALRAAASALAILAVFKSFKSIYWTAAVLSAIADFTLAAYLTILNRIQVQEFVSVELQTGAFGLIFMGISVILAIWLVQDPNAQLQVLVLMYRVLQACSLGVTPCDALAFYLNGIGIGIDLSVEDLGKMAKRMRRRTADSREMNALEHGTKEKKSKLFGKIRGFSFGTSRDDSVSEHQPPVTFAIED
jgi:hypothetical protein